MKHYILSIFALFAFAGIAQAQNVEGLNVSDLAMNRDNDYMTVNLQFDLSDLHVNGNRAMLYTPRIVGDKDSVDLYSIGIYGRRRYIYYVRNGESTITGPTEQSFLKSEAPEQLTYKSVIPFESWMDGARLVLVRNEYGCCNTIVDSERDEVCQWLGPLKPYTPAMAYVSPRAEAEKSRSISGQAYIDFPVNKTEIYPDYRKNPQELAKIQETIEPLAKDDDITVKSLSIKGYASPESSYANNTRLAKGRTAALKDYVNTLYHFGEDKFATSYEPEDWAGLRAYVEKSNLKNKDAILALIDSNREPDNKEWMIKSKYPEDYAFLLQNCYPALRHSDYRIEYVIRSYTDVNEIKQVMKDKPQNLSLQEFYLVAQSYKPGSDEYNEVFETAVRMYPNDEVANLNAACNALQRGDLDAAERYLQKSGKRPETIYSYAALAFLRGDYDKAVELANQASREGVKEQSASLLDQIAKIRERVNQQVVMIK